MSKTEGLRITLLVTSKEYYRRGLKEYVAEKGFLVETCRAAQDAYKKMLEYFEYI